MSRCMRTLSSVVERSVHIGEVTGPIPVASTRKSDGVGCENKMTMEIKTKLGEVGLNLDNAIVIGSGILNALSIRESGDVDVVVREEKYQELARGGRFKKEQNHGHEVLFDGVLEIGTGWDVIGKMWKFDDLLARSIVMDGVRYNTIEFLLDVKRRWVADGEGRPKDIKDVELMERYLSDLKK